MTWDQAHALAMVLRALFHDRYSFSESIQHRVFITVHPWGEYDRTIATLNGPVDAATFIAGRRTEFYL